MCGCPDRTNTTVDSEQSPPQHNSNTTMKEPNHVFAESENCFSNILELAANDDVQGFNKILEHDASVICQADLWYGRQMGSRQMVLEHRTPLMVAATYGSLDVLKLILAEPGVDVNFSDIPDKSTALHCAASGGSVDADEVVKLLLESGADANALDMNGHRPFDIIVVPPKLPSKRVSLEYLLANNDPHRSIIGPKLRVSVRSSGTSSPPLSSSPGNDSSSCPSDSMLSPKILKLSDHSINQPPEKKEYPIDPSLPDIKNSIYATDEFRMFSFKVRHCSRAYSHDWTECPFVHPGENARRRDPRSYNYSCVPCPEFRKGTCRRGDLCEYAHGVFECWLHPAQYRTRLCKDGTSCNRRVCFFAHLPEELRPLYVSTGSAAPSPRASASAATVMDMAAAMNLFPGSPSAISAMSPSPFSPQCMSPPTNACSNSPLPPQQNFPTLHLPGSNLQSSRLRSSLSARDIPPEDYNMLLDFDAQQHLLDDHMASFSQQRAKPSSMMRGVRTKTLAPSNLEEAFYSEIASSPRYSDQAAAAVFSPTHKSVLLNQFQHQQSFLAPINTSNIYSPKSVEHPLLQASFNVSSPGRMSPRSVEPISPMSARLSALALREQQQQQLRSFSSREFGIKHTSSLVGSPVNSWSNWGSPNGKVDWSVNGGGDDMGQLRRSSSFELGNNGEEPDLSWVQSLVKESPPETEEKHGAPVSGATSSGEGLANKASKDPTDYSVVGAWLEHMQLDQIVTQ
ncbi:zinc finger CCCH domain-containing protein 30-like [Chenopodium quinoa]|uniref:zinc finger CCCH domain-containing protein 30-like n=1 Tax=Chenopodium quinoa TaxID=63459 RepID=UPI000B7735D7|nr:zinc finger CCCH domain-containing protein 30-like [Chenopodium quinoa]